MTCCGRKIYLIDEVRKAFKSLYPGIDHHVLVTESDSLSPSLHYADKSFVVPRIKEEGYLERIIDICLQEGVDFLLPSKDSELTLFAGSVVLNEMLKLPLSSLETIRVCEDKIAFFDYLKNYFIMPDTWMSRDGSDNLTEYPVVVKERGVGIETSGYYICNNDQQLNNAISQCMQPVIQKYIKGSEYTVDAIFNKNSEMIVAVPRERLRVRQFVSDVGLACKDESFEKNTEEVGRKLNLKGPVNVQWIRTSDGVDYLIEVNPRISGGLQITLAACPSYVEAFLADSLGLPINIPPRNLPMIGIKYDSMLAFKPDFL